jgi:hypothetical protein
LPWTREWARRATLLRLILRCAHLPPSRSFISPAAHSDVKPSNLLLTGDGSGVLSCRATSAPRARARGEAFEESSIYSLNLMRTACLRYDIVSVGATLASVLSASLKRRAAGIAALREAIGSLGERASSSLWRFVDACLCFVEDGAANELERLRAQLAIIANKMRPALGPHAAAVLKERDVWLR